MLYVIYMETVGKKIPLMAQNLSWPAILNEVTIPSAWLKRIITEAYDCETVCQISSPTFTGASSTSMLMPCSHVLEIILWLPAHRSADVLQQKSFSVRMVFFETSLFLKPLSTQHSYPHSYPPPYQDCKLTPTMLQLSNMINVLSWCLFLVSLTTWRH